MNYTHGNRYQKFHKKLFVLFVVIRIIRRWQQLEVSGNILQHRRAEICKANDIIYTYGKLEREIHT